MSRISRVCACLLVCQLALSTFPFADEVKLAPAEFFDEHVQPILAANCFKCHGGEAKIKGGLRLTDRKSFLAGGDTGPALEDDIFLEAINYQSYEMPPSGKLLAEEIAILTEWVKMGAPWSSKTDDFGIRGEIKVEYVPPQVNEQTKSFWAYQRVTRPRVPAVVNNDWVSNPIDAFIVRKLDRNKLTPNGPADKVKLLRRAYYDLTGLPPSPEEAADFVKDDSKDAYGKVIDRLLGSHHYGERWGRHWLDLVRYAESNSFERDSAKPHIWRYRDYVVNSFNEDKPYDQFIREQIAGDELDERTADSYSATGYYRIGQWDDEPTDKLQADFDGLDDLLATTG